MNVEKAMYTTRVEDTDGTVRYFGAVGPGQAAARERKQGEYARQAMKIEPVTMSTSRKLFIKCLG